MIYGTPVPVPFELRRPRVVAALKEGSALTIVSAPRGSGKTVAVASWARESSGDGVWVTVDRGGMPRSLFWLRVLGLAADAAVLAGRSSGRPALAEATDVRRALLAWTSALHEPTRIVIDGAEDLDRVAASDIEWLVAMSSLVRVVVITRSDVAETGLEGLDNTILDADALRFSTDEIVAVLHSTTGDGDHRAALEIARLTDGIPLAVTAVARALVGERLGDGAMPRAARSAMLVAVRSAVLGVGPGGPRVAAAALAAVALLETATMAEAIEVVADSDVDVPSVLDSAVRAGYGRWRAGHAGELFVFTPVVAHALSAPYVLDEADRSVLSRAAAIRARRGETFEAVSLALEAHELEQAQQIGSTRMIDLVTDHHESLLAQLSRIPSAEIGRYPLLILFMAVLHEQNRRGRATALRLYAWAEWLAHQRGRGAGSPRFADRAVLFIARSIAARLLGLDRLALISARSALEVLDAASPEQLDALGGLRSLVLGQAAVSLLFTGRLSRAAEVSTRHATDHGTSDAVRQNAWANGAVIEAIRGDLGGARDRLEAANRLESWRGDFFYYPTLVAEAILRVERLDVEGARSSLDRLSREHVHSEWWPIASGVRALCDIMERRPLAAETLASALDDRERARITTASRRSITGMLVLALLASGHAGEARGVARRGSLEGGLTTAILHLVGGRSAEAITVVTRALREPVRSPRVRSMLLVVRASAASRLGDRSVAARDVAAVLGVLGSTSLRTPWGFAPAADRPVLDDLARTTPGVDPLLLDELERMPTLLPDVANVAQLTRRERDVIERVAAGGDNAAIAVDLGVSINTVRKQRASAYRKLGASTREQAVAAAVERGVLDGRD